MQQDRQRLTLRLSAKPKDALPLPDLLKQAIAKKRCIDATYNRGRILLAPHALYTRHDEPHVDGVVLQRDGQAPRELKLGTFRLTGLTDGKATDFPFDPFTGFDAAAERYQGTLIAAI
jgi:hypothetical protein